MLCLVYIFQSLDLISAVSKLKFSGGCKLEIFERFETFKKTAKIRTNIIQGVAKFWYTLCLLIENIEIHHISSIKKIRKGLRLQDIIQEAFPHHALRCQRPRINTIWLLRPRTGVNALFYLELARFGCIKWKYILKAKQAILSTFYHHIWND